MNSVEKQLGKDDIWWRRHTTRSVNDVYDIRHTTHSKVNLKSGCSKKNQICSHVQGIVSIMANYLSILFLLSRFLFFSISQNLKGKMWKRKCHFSKYISLPVLPESLLNTILKCCDFTHLCNIWFAGFNLWIHSNLVREWGTQQCLELRREILWIWA